MVIAYSHTDNAQVVSSLNIHRLGLQSESGEENPVWGKQVASLLNLELLDLCLENRDRKQIPIDPW